MRFPITVHFCPFSLSLSLSFFLPVSTSLSPSTSLLHFSLYPHISPSLSIPPLSLSTPPSLSPSLFLSFSTSLSLSLPQPLYPHSLPRLFPSLSFSTSLSPSTSLYPHISPSHSILPLLLSLSPHLSIPTFLSILPLSLSLSFFLLSHTPFAEITTLSRFLSDFSFFHFCPFFFLCSIFFVFLFLKSLKAFTNFSPSESTVRFSLAFLCIKYQQISIWHMFCGIRYQHPSTDRYS